MPIVSNDLWKSIIEKKARDEKYRIFNCGEQELDGFPGIKITFLDKGWISDVISKTMLINNKPNNSIFIVAQTGSGKTTFMFDKCIPVAIQEQKRVLYLCSRKALSLQIKKHAIKDKNNSDVRVGDICVKDFGDFYTDKGLERNINFGNIDVMTYHTFIKNQSNVNPNNYSFIILDETHFFLSDATFNPLTEVILSEIIMRFQNVRRIYLTATPQECLDCIWEEESYNNFKTLLPIYSTMDIYVMEEDYCYMNPCFFTNMEEIASKIMEDSSEFWLVFVKDKKVGEELKQLLSQENLTVEFITAETDKENDVYKKLIEEEILTTKILISTKVLDVGVNVKTKGLNIVIFEDDIVEIKQMIGRKRLKGSENVNVYFYIPLIKELSKRKGGIVKKIADIKQKISSANTETYFETVEPPFFLINFMLNYNSFHLKKLQLDLKHCNKLIEALAPLGNSTDKNKLYAKLLLSNFNGVVYDEKLIFLTQTGDKLSALLNEYIGNPLNKEEFQLLANRIVEIIGDSRVRMRENAPGIATINKDLEKYGYSVEVCKSLAKYIVKIRS